MYTKIKNTILLFLAIFTVMSCSLFNDPPTPDINPEIVPKGAQFGFTDDVSNNIKNYTDIYFFNGVLPNLDFFKSKGLNVERTPTYIQTDAPVGKWNVVLVGCNEGDIRGQLIPPTITAAKNAIPMYEAPVAGGNMPNVPEIRVGLINGQPIVVNQTHTAATDLTRNVAKVRVVITQATGLNAAGTDHYITLSNIPNKLAWDGSLFPNKTAPSVSASPMKKSVTLKPHGSITDALKSDTVDFMVLTHKQTYATDTTTNKIQLGVYLDKNGGGKWPLAGKNIATINITPKANKIMIVNVTVKAGIDIKVGIEEWRTVNQSVEIIGPFALKYVSNTGKIAKYTMDMPHERNWWVTLDNTTDFEFVDPSRAFGQKTTSPAVLEVRRKTAGAGKTVNMTLFVEGLNPAGVKTTVTTLTQ